MKHYVIYDPATGTVVSTIASSIEQTNPVQYAPGLAFVPHDAEISGFDRWRVVDGTLIERATMTPTVSAATIAADGIATATITGLPDPCVVSIAGAVTAGPVQVTGGALTLASTQPGEIRIAVRADPTHKPWETTVHAA